MEAQRNLVVHFSHQDSFIRYFGDAIWEEICDKCRTDIIIAVKDVAKDLAILKYHKKPELYIRLILQNVIQEHLNAGTVPPVRWIRPHHQTHFIL